MTYRISPPGSWNLVFQHAIDAGRAANSAIWFIAIDSPVGEIGIDCELVVKFDELQGGVVLRRMVVDFVKDNNAVLSG